MRNYYAHLGDNQEGPFSLDELKLKKISKETLVWYEGLEEWIAASKVEDLKDLFISIPPPFNKQSINVPPPKVEVEKTTKIEPEITYNSTLPEVKKKSYNVYWIIGCVTILLLFLIYKSTMNSMEIDLKQSENTLDLQKQVIQQNEKIKEQEQLEANRKAEQKRQQQEATKAQKALELENLKTEYDNAITTLRAENVKLEKIKEFVFLRSASEREQQIQAELETIRTWENEVDRLKKEIEKY